MKCEILLWLRKQEGFLDLITLVALDGREVTTISFWDQEMNAHAYSANGYPEALQTLGELLDGTPYVKTLQVVGSSIHRLAPAQENLDHDGKLTQETGSTRLGYGSCQSPV